MGIPNAHVDTPYLKTQGGLAGELATLLPPGARIAAYVRSGGSSNIDSPVIRANLVTTLDAGLDRCRSGYGDVVVVLPDHAENIDAADKMSNLKAGTRILGLGRGLLRPTFTWTVTGGTFLLDVDSVELINCRLVMADTANGGVTVTAAMTVSGDGCAIRGCDVRFGADADDNVTKGIIVTGDDFEFEGNDCLGATAAECTTFLELTGADRAKLINNRIVGATSAVAVGLIRFLTTASTDVTIDGLTIRNNKAASTDAITGLAGCGGQVNNLFMVVLSNALAALTGAFATPANFVFGRQCYVANTIAERAALFGTESA